MTTRKSNKKFLSTSDMVKKALCDFESLSHLEGEIKKEPAIDLKTIKTLKGLLKDLSK